MKKIISILLVLAMALSMATVAFADQEPAKKITITGGEGRTFVAYKLLGVSVSLKTGTHHDDIADCDGTNHKDACYNYDYTIENDAYRAILQIETLANGRNELWGNAKPEGHPELVTDEQIIAYLAYQIGDKGVDFSTMRAVADRIYRAILADDTITAPDATPNINGEFEVESGYWMVVDTTDYDEGTGVSNSLVLVDTVTDSNITINVKTGLPTIEVKVKDIEDSEDSNIADNPWLDTADHDAGDVVPFKVTATLPSNVLSYGNYEMTFDVDLPEGFTLVENSVVVLMYETKHKADVDIDMNDFVAKNEDDAKNYEKKFNTTVDADGFKVSSDNVLAIEGLTKDTAFVVYFEATLNADTTKTVVGAEGNIVSASLEYSNNPYSDSKGYLAADEAVVYTYELIVNKTDSHGHPLDKAGFTLYKKNAAGEYVVVKEIDAAEDLTQFVWKGLDDGDYKLVEDEKPAGYSQMADVLFSIYAEHVEKADGSYEIVILDAGLMGLGEKENDVYTGSIVKEIVNLTGTVLPETGATGTALLIGGGAALIIVAAVFLITRKKMSIYEM